MGHPPRRRMRGYGHTWHGGGGLSYRESAGAPSGEWLLGAAGLYVTSLAWTASVTGAVALLFVDVCSL